MKRSYCMMGLLVVMPTSTRPWCFRLSPCPNRRRSAKCSGLFANHWSIMDGN